MIVLSSTSATRHRLLRQSGLLFDIARPALDERVAKSALKQVVTSAIDVARMLAQSKASSVGRTRPGAHVIGADQMLECDGVWYDKPPDRQGARRHLQALRGKTHHLFTAAAIAHQGKIVWSHVETAHLTMRDISDPFLDEYLEKAGDGVLRSVGAYELEGIGVQLFDRVEGDFFSILGLPLIPLLAALRERGALSE